MVPGRDRPQFNAATPIVYLNTYRCTVVGQAIAALKQDHQQGEKIVLQGPDFLSDVDEDPTDLRGLGEAFLVNQNMSVIEMNTVLITNDLADELVKAFRNNPRIVELHLFRCTLEIGVAEKLSLAISMLRSLETFFCGCKNIIGEDLAFLQDGARKAKIKKFDLSFTSVSDKNASIAMGRLIGKNSNLSTLLMKKTRFSSYSSLVLGRSVAFSQQLVTISLFNCELRDKGAVILSRSLLSDDFRCPTRNFKLWVAFCSIGNVGAIALANLLKKNASIRSLGIRGNFMDTVGFKAICASILEHDAIDYLSVRFLNNVGVMGINALALMLLDTRALRDIWMTSGGYYSHRTEERLSLAEIESMQEVMEKRTGIKFGQKDN